MNGKGRPQAKLRLRETEQVAQRRKNEQGDRVENKDGSQGDSHFFFVRVKNWCDRGDGASATDSSARRDEIGRISTHAKEFADGESHKKSKRNTQGGVDKTTVPAFKTSCRFIPKPRATTEPCSNH